MEIEKSRQPRHSIGVVCRRTGLKPDVIRAWERRYKAVEPKRTETNRRYYTDEQIERLVLLREATLSGRQIGQVSHLSTSELRELVATDKEAISRAPRSIGHRTDVPGESHLTACLGAIRDLDSYDLQFQLERASIDLTHPQLIDEVIGPVLEWVGEQWAHGQMRIAHEHMACAVIRSFLSTLKNSYSPPQNAPYVVVGTPSRQRHEMGALIAAATAASEGWRVIYLGSDLPAEEFAASASQKGVKVVVLSIVYPKDDPLLDRELLRLGRLLGESASIIVGGSAADSYQKPLKQLGAYRVSSIEELRSTLRQLRQ